MIDEGTIAFLQSIATGKGPEFQVHNMKDPRIATYKNSVKDMRGKVLKGLWLVRHANPNR